MPTSSRCVLAQPQAHRVHSDQLPSEGVNPCNRVVPEVHPDENAVDEGTSSIHRKRANGKWRDAPVRGRRSHSHCPPHPHSYTVYTHKSCLNLLFNPIRGLNIAKDLSVCQFAVYTTVAPQSFGKGAELLNSVSRTISVGPCLSTAP